MKVNIRCRLSAAGVLVFVLLAAGCAQRPVVDARVTGSGHVPQGHASELWQRDRLVDTAQQMLGTPYHYGGESPGQGFDCSGLVYFSYARLGIEVPRTTTALRHNSRPVSLRELQPGDLVFFDLTGAKASHVGIYVGGGMFVHAPSSGKVVSRASLDNPYWSRHLAGAGTFF